MPVIYDVPPEVTVERPVSQMALVPLTLDLLESEWAQYFDQARVELAGEDGELRRTVVGWQALIEWSLAYGLQEGEYAEVHAIIHTPKPSTPLRESCRSQPKIDGDSILTEVDRVVTLHGLLKAGAKMDIVYSREQWVPGQQGYEQVEENLRRYENLQGHPVSYMDSVPTGATYFFKTKDGKACVFSINGHQQGTKGQHEASDWVVWFGREGNAFIDARVTELGVFMKPLGLSR